MRDLQERGALQEREERQRRIAELAPWFHNLHLPDGTQTAPDHLLGDFPSFKWREIAPHLPGDLDGWEVLDIGCNAGFYTLELARRGARVTGVDVNPYYLEQARWAAAEFGVEDRVSFRQMQVYDLASEEATYDLVLFMGVFYHLRYPMLGLDIVARKVRRLLLFQSLSLPGDEVHPAPFDLGIYEREAMHERGWPRMAFVEHRLCGDPTNWWVPNHAGIEAMLRSSGLRVVGRPGHEIYLAEPDPDQPSCVTTWNAEELRAAVSALCRPPWNGKPASPSGEDLTNGHRSGAGTDNARAGNGRKTGRSGP